MKFNIENGVLTGVVDENIEVAVIPEGVETIGEKAFSKCKSLKSVSFPNSLKVIEKSAFEHCKNLESVDFSFASLDLIGEYAFRCCKKLEGLKVVAKEVGKLAFCNTGIKDLQLISKSVCESAFAYCRSLEKAKVYTEYLGYRAFEYCEKIKLVELKGVNTEYDSFYDEDGDEIEGGYVHVAGKNIIRYAFQESNMDYFEFLSEDNVIVYGKELN